MRTLADAAALEMTLANGSWVHLRTGGRWFAGWADARAAVRGLGVTPCLPPDGQVRLAGAIDRQVLLAIEALGWRHWPTPA